METVYTVLIIDDNFEDRFILKRYLQKTKLSLVVLEAESGPEGIDLLTTPVDELESRYPGIHAPVILFLDINMPLMNGWEFVEELDRRREDIRLNPMVVLMYSTSDADYEKKKASEYETVSNYIVKGESTPESLKHAILTGAKQHAA